MLAIPFKISPFCIILSLSFDYKKYLFDPHQHCVSRLLLRGAKELIRAYKPYILSSSS
jgi:hypothetical protein